MKIILAEHFGVCFGVRDAIAQAERLAEEGSLTILGELVHNPIVRERLRAQGVQESSLEPPGAAPQNSTGLSSRVLKHGEVNVAEAAGEAPVNAIRSTFPPRVMVTAHGASDERREAWRRSGAIVADGTCPLVRHAHEQLRSLVAAGFFPIVIGQRGHVEVNGLVGDFSEAIVLGAAEDICQLPPRPRYGIISQTTQPIDFVRKIVDLIGRPYPESEVRFVDTVCKPTKDRQLALRKLIGVADAIVIVGGRASNNTRQLVKTCRAAGKTVFHIERPDEILPGWFEQVDTVGLTAGTSTLLETVQAVHVRLIEISAAQTTHQPNQ